MIDEETRQDDPSILDTDRLFRRIPPNHIYNDNGIKRPSSAAFKATELSVNIESLMIEQKRLPEDSVKNYPGHCLTAIVAGAVRSHGYPIVKDNVSAKGELPPDPAHGLVLGKKKDKFANAMVRSHQWIVPPSDD